MLILKTTDGLRQSYTSEAKTIYNNFNGWFCGAGLNFLWINSNGKVFGNVCRHSGCYGSVFDEILLPSEPIICPTTACYCASDIDILKSKFKEDFKPLSINIQTNNLLKYNNEEILVVENVTEKSFFKINWNIGKRCNYDCSYCPSNVHDNFSPHLTLEIFKKAFDSLLTQIPNDKKIKITFTGGEPTINPHYFDIVQYSVNNGAVVYTNTNGTSNINKLKKLMMAGGLHLSIHTEFAQLNKLKIKIIQLENFNIGELVVKYMFPINGLSLLKEFMINLPKNTKNFKFTVEPLVDKSNKNTIFKYTDEELEFIRNVNDRT